MITSRRQFIQSAGLAAGWAMLPGLALAGKSDDGFINLIARPGEMPLLGDGKTATRIWGYEGKSPGPQIRVRQGEEVKVRLINKLPQPTTMHWHGVRIVNGMDGVPELTQKAVPPGGRFDYVFRAPDAGTFWYHTHNRTWEQMARGLYGTLIVEEKDKPAFDQDLTLVVDDWRLTEEGQIHEKSLGALHEWAHGGRSGRWITVNGAHRPQIAIRQGSRVRLRLVNVCNASIYALKLEGLKAHLIALDGQPVAPRDVSDEPMLFSPAQRIDLALETIADHQGKASLRSLRRDGSDELAGFVIEPSSPGATTRPGLVRLPENPLSKTISMPDALKVDVKMEGGAMGGMRSAIYKGRKLGIDELIQNKHLWALAGVTGLPEKPLFSAKRGQSVVLNLINATAWPHPMHIHGFHFRALERNGKTLATAPWRDTELIMPRETVSLGFVADNPGKWLLHCHTLEHTAAGMITWFEVAA
ncbi:MAG: copper oxidase [Hyphomicrobiales bacterium]|nr:MAG: copper oxidase [Hyphomicrobiales bacterium]